MNKPKVSIDLKLPSSYEDMFFGASNGVGIIPTDNSGFRVYYPEIDHERCSKCMLCWIYCPEGCIDKTFGDLLIDMDFCKGCGICAQECPRKCIVMVKDGGLDE